MSLERTAGLPKKQSCWLKSCFFLNGRQRGFLENTACYPFEEQAFFMTRFEIEKGSDGQDNDSDDM